MIKVTVLVLNGDYRPINVCTVKRAVVLLLKEKAEVVEQMDDRLRAEKVSLVRPSVIRLVAYVRIPWDSRRRITRRAVLARDDFLCQYCSAETSAETRLTIDHVVPRSKGGKTEWTNVVASCSPCNIRKRDMLPKQAGMRLKHQPRPPESTVFVRIAVRRVPASWAAYV